MSKNDSIGTKHSGYADGKQGPFMCSRCVHFSADKNTCDHPDVKADADANLIPVLKGKPVVDPSGCCTYFRPEDRSKSSLGKMLVGL